jgi:hypothetical protein
VDQVKRIFLNQHLVLLENLLFLLVPNVIWIKARNGTAWCIFVLFFTIFCTFRFLGFIINSVLEHGKTVFQELFLRSWHKKRGESHGYDRQRHGVVGLFEEITGAFGFDESVEIFDGEFVEEEGSQFDFFADEFEEGSLLFFEGGKRGEFFVPAAIGSQSDQVLVNNFFDDETAQQKGSFLVLRYLQVVLIRIAINKRHLFNSKSFIRIVAGIERANAKEFINLIVKSVNKLVEHLDYHEDDSFEDAQVDHACFVAFVVRYFYLRVFFFLFPTILTALFLLFVLLVNHPDFFVKRNLLELLNQRFIYWSDHFILLDKVLF